MTTFDVIETFEKGESKACPYCEREGRKKLYCCWKHEWVYAKWWEGYKKGVRRIK